MPLYETEVIAGAFLDSLGLDSGRLTTPLENGGSGTCRNKQKIIRTRPPQGRTGSDYIALSQ